MPDEPNTNLTINRNRVTRAAKSYPNTTRQNITQKTKQNKTKQNKTNRNKVGPSATHPRS